MTSPDTEFISILGAAGSPEAPARVSAHSLPQVLPILGLSDIVIFPGMIAPLLVETPQSTKLIDDVVAGDRLLGVVLQRKPEAENPTPEEMHNLGCAARLLKMLKFPDNTVRVLVEGLWRVRLKEYTNPSPYLSARFELMKDITEDSVELTAMMRNAQGQFQEIIRLSPALSEQVKIAAPNTEDPGHFTDLIAVNLNLSLEERQKLLETTSIATISPRPLVLTKAPRPPCARTPANRVLSPECRGNPETRTEPPAPFSLPVKTDASWSGSSTGSGRRRAASTMPNMVVLVPIPSASERTATAVKPRFFASMRRPNFNARFAPNTL